MFDLVPPDFVVIPFPLTHTEGQEDVSRDMDVQPPRLLGASILPRPTGDDARQPILDPPDDDWEHAKARENSSSPPGLDHHHQSGDESPRKVGRNRTDTMIYNDPAFVTDAMSKFYSKYDSDAAIADLSESDNLADTEALTEALAQMTAEFEGSDGMELEPEAVDVDVDVEDAPVVDLVDPVDPVDPLEGLPPLSEEVVLPTDVPSAEPAQPEPEPEPAQPESEPEPEPAPEPAPEPEEVREHVLDVPVDAEHQEPAVNVVVDVPEVAEELVESPVDPGLHPPPPTATQQPEPEPMVATAEVL